MKYILPILIKLCSVDTLSLLLAKVIAALLKWASKTKGKSWDVAKNIIVKANGWTSLFLQVYDDDNLTEDEEKMIADAIKNQTSISKIVDILRKQTDVQTSVEK